MQCTWVDCTEEGTHPQLDNLGNEWANLCKKHHDELEEAIDKLDAKGLLRAWVRASGGAKKMAEGFFG